jgi:hypothetical protein
MKAPVRSRRDFLKTVAGISIASAADAKAATSSLFSAIQMGPRTMLDKGIERCLDLVQETAGINALMIYSHLPR